jgi:hypothetical protein
MLKSEIFGGVMSFADAYSKRRRVLIEITPSLGARLRLWIHKLRHPRHRWFAGRGTGATKPASGSQS